MITNTAVDNSFSLFICSLPLVEAAAAAAGLYFAGRPPAIISAVDSPADLYSQLVTRREYRITSATAAIITIIYTHTRARAAAMLPLYYHYYTAIPYVRYALLLSRAYVCGILLLYVSSIRGVRRAASVGVVPRSCSELWVYLPTYCEIAGGKNE